MQAPTCTGLRIRSPSDARTIFHAVACEILPMITRRLDARDRNTISNGSIYVWEERSHKNDLTTVGMERWTDGIRWGPTRVRREGFLFYHQNQEYLSPPYVTGLDGDGQMSAARDPTRMLLVKQTFTVTTDTPNGKRKWHLIAYFTPDKVDQLDTIDDRPYLASLVVPHEKYRSAARGGGDDTSEASDVEKSSPPSRPYYNNYPSTTPTTTAARNLPTTTSTSSSTTPNMNNTSSSGTSSPTVKPAGVAPQSQSQPQSHHHHHPHQRRRRSPPEHTVSGSASGRRSDSRARSGSSPRPLLHHHPHSHRPYPTPSPYPQPPLHHHPQQQQQQHHNHHHHHHPHHSHPSQNLQLHPRYDSSNPDRQLAPLAFLERERSQQNTMPLGPHSRHPTDQSMIDQLALFR